MLQVLLMHLLSAPEPLIRKILIVIIILILVAFNTGILISASAIPFLFVIDRMFNHTNGISTVLIL